MRSAYALGGAGGTDHAFAGAEGAALAHGTRGEVGAEDDEAADEFFGQIGFFDAGDDGALADGAGVEREFHEFVRFFEGLGGEDARNAEIDGGELVDVDDGGERLFARLRRRG